MLALALLLFFSTVLWHLAKGSLNEYLKSQVALQGQYYSGVQSTIDQATFEAHQGIASFEGFSLSNIPGYNQAHALVIDKASAQLVRDDKQLAPHLITIKKLTINNAQLWLEHSKNTNNLSQLKQKIAATLAAIYPAHYPELSAKLYAAKHPELNVALIDESKIASSNSIETAAKTAARNTKRSGATRGKTTTKIRIMSMVIHSLEVTTTKDNKRLKTHLETINLAQIGGDEGIEIQQLGGELLRILLSTAIDNAPSYSGK